MEVHYTQRQITLEAEYDRAYAAWYELLSDEDREMLESADVTRSATLSGPYISKRRRNLANIVSRPELGSDKEDSYLEATKFGFTVASVEVVDKFPDLLAELGVSTEVAKKVANLIVGVVERRVKWEQSRILRHVIAGFLGPGNLRINAYALCYAAGLDALNGLPTVRKCAKQLGCTPNAISKVAVAWRERLGLPENSYSKPLAARVNYRKAQLKSAWRKQPFKAAVK